MRWVGGTVGGAVDGTVGGAVGDAVGGAVVGAARWTGGTVARWVVLRWYKILCGGAMGGGRQSTFEDHESSAEANASGTQVRVPEQFRVNPEREADVMLL